MGEEKWDIPQSLSMGDFTRNLSSTSLENLFDIYRSKGGVHRIDSEDQFKKFIEKIPSMSNLAGAVTSQSMQQANADQMSQQIAMFQQQQNLLAPGSSPLAAQLPESGGLNIQGIPRVPSLDLLRQMMSSPYPVSQLKASGLVKEDPPSPPLPLIPQLIPPSVSVEPREHQSNGSESMHILPDPVVVPLQPLDTRMPGQNDGMHQSGSEGGLPDAAEPSSSFIPNEGLEIVSRGRNSAKESGQGKAEIRRARRMLSNRESARRSRRRKQEHLGALEEQIANLETDKDQLSVKVEKLERQLTSANEHNASLRNEVEELRQKLGIQGSEPAHKRSRGV